MEIDVFSRQESLDHLQRRVAGAVERRRPTQVAEELGDLPLAIEQAGAWLAETGMPAAEYVAQLDGAVRRRLLDAEPADDYPTPVAATWRLSFDRLRERVAGRGPAP